VAKKPRTAANEELCKAEKVIQWRRVCDVDGCKSTAPLFDDPGKASVWFRNHKNSVHKAK
jgi:hypothetical protein